jgi:DNA-binding beta-propeller fold protein YncE
MHIIPTLRRVEEAYPNEVVVIGVHSPKFAAERDPANVAQAIARYGIGHPVIHDPDHVLWREYGVRAWPTLTFVSPDGYVIGQVSGEPDPQKLLDAVATAIAESKTEGVLRPSPLVLSSPVTDTASGRLRFPGKIKPVPENGAGIRWALADSGHHQIVMLDGEGKELRRVGNGAAGFTDGNTDVARFNGPQGLIASRDAVFVADTGNHALRRIDLASGTVITLAGTGHRGRPLASALPGKDAALASPWDLELSDSRLYFANAGTHQIGVFDLDAGTLARFVGSGAEAIVDGDAAEAALAQPSGLALSPDGRTLFVADSETSAVRAVGTDTGAVRTIIGKGLFAFGHVNGTLDAARLQHPLGVAVLDGTHIAVADSYNNAVRLIDLTAGIVSDLDEGFTCIDSLCLPFAEPAGIVADGPDRLLVVDTNNHRIVAVDRARRITETWFR